jgi:hypothetical protein
MTVEIKSLRVSADMDASAYAAGAAQKVAADKAMIASGQATTAAFTQTETKISQAGDVLSRLSKQYVDGYAAAQRFNSALRDLSSGIERGKISAEQTGPILDGIYRKFGLMGDASLFMARGQTEAAAAVTRLNAKLAEQHRITPANANANQGGLARFGSLNATSQFQDIAITSAMGQSPFTIALQQGTQLGMALEQQLGDQGAKGLVKGLGSAFMGLLTPINLLAIGLTGAVAVAIQFGSKLLPQIKSLKDATEDQRKAVTDLAAAYGDAGLKADDFYKKSIIASESGARRSNEELQKAAATENLSVQSQLGSPFTVGRGRETFFGVKPEFSQFGEAISILNGQIKAGRPDYDAFEKSIAGVVAQNPGLQTTADKILDIVGAATEAASRLGKTADYIKDLNRASVGNFDRSAQAGRDQSVMSQRFGDDPFAKEREQERQKVIALKEAQDERNRSLDRTLDSARQDVELVGKTTAEVEGLRLAVQLEAQVREEAAKNNVKADETEIANIRAKAAEYGKLKAQQEAATTIKSQQDDLELQRAEIGAVGQNQLAHDALIATLKTEMEIRKLGADAIGGQADEMRANTAAANANAEALAHATMQSDLLFQRRQILRNSEDQQIASALKSAGLPDDLNSQEAQMMRFNMALQESKDTFKGFFSDMFSGLKEGKTLWDSFKDAAVNALSKIADKLIDRGLDGIFNSIFGGEGQTSNGGLLGQLLNSGNSGSSQQSGSTGRGGILGSILGGRNQSASSMQVQAGVVYVNGAAVGGVGGGLSDILSKLGSPSFKADTTLSDILGYGGAANDNASQDYIQSRIDGAFGTSGGLGGIFSGGAGLTGSMSSYAAAIRSIESAGSGGYSALGPVLKSGDQALGAYQVMRSNLPSWSTQAFGKPMSQSEFLSNPSAQDAIFSQQFGKSLSKYGNPQDAASAWFTGGPLSSGADKADILGTTGSKYVDKFNAALEKVGGTASSASGALNSLGGASEGLISQFSKMGQSLLSQLTPGTSSSSWFQGLAGMFGGSSGALGFMNSISPAATSDILSGSWGLFANGAAFRHGNVVPFASGDVFSRPTYFPMSGGKTGVMGEAGDEAIMPLRRGPDGKLGVAAHTQKAANDRPHQTINQTNNFIFRENPAAPASQNQIAAKSAKSLERLTRVS